MLELALLDFKNINGGITLTICVKFKHSLCITSHSWQTEKLENFPKHLFMHLVHFEA